MIWLILALLLAIGLLGVFATYSLLSGMVLILAVCLLGVFGVRRIYRVRFD